MKIGSLYLVKKYFWLLFPTKEIASARCHGRAVKVGAPAAAAANIDAYWSKELNCEVTYFSPKSIVVLLEEEGKFKKFLTSDGRIGWTWFHETYNDWFILNK